MKNKIKENAKNKKSFYIKPLKIIWKYESVIIK